MPTLRIHALCSMILLAACASEPGAEMGRATAPLEPTVRDSAGVSIRLQAPGALERAPAVRLDSIPIAVIKGSAEDVGADVSTVYPDAFLSDGRLVGHDGDRQVVVVFAADGSSRQEFGRRGSGPGEFSYITKVSQLPGDTILVSDIRNTRATLLDPASGAMQSVSLVDAVAEGARSAVGRIGDRLVLPGTLVLGQPKGGAMPQLASSAVLLATSGHEMRVVYRSAPPPAPDPSGAPPGMVAVRLMPSAGFITPQAVQTVGNRILAGDGNSWKFVVFDTTGIISEIFGLERPRQPVTDAIWSAQLDGVIRRAINSSTGRTPDTAAMRAALERDPRPDSLPAWLRLEVTPNGTIWIIEEPVPGTQGWSAVAFDIDGRLLGRLSMPSGDPPRRFGDDRLLFRTEDNNGIATLTVRRVRFSG